MVATRFLLLAAYLLLTALPLWAHLPDELPAPVPVPDPLAPEQRAWLNAHPVLRLAPDPDFPPIEFFNAHGEYSGLAADYAHLLEQRLGLRFTLVRCADWNEVLASAQRREVDVLNAAVATPERARYLAFTPAYLHMPMVIITRQTGLLLRAPGELSGLRVALVRGYGHAELIARENPALIPVPVASTAAGLRLTAFGQVDAFYHDLATASYTMEEEGLTNLRVSGRGTTDNNSGFAVRSDWPELAGVLARGLELITPAERAALQAHWIHMEIPHEHMLQEYAPGIILGASLLLLALLANMLLRREVKRRTRKLAASEHLLQAALKIGHMGYGRIEADGTVFWSPEVRHMHGLAPETALTPETMGANIHPEDRERLLQAREVLRRGEYAPGVEYRVLLPGGRMRWLYGEWQAVHDERGRYAGVVGVNQDITARKEHELELQREKDFSERILNAQRDTVAIIDAETGRLVRWNRRLCEVSGYSDEEIAAMPVMDLHPAEQHAQVEALAAGLRTGHILTVQVDILTRDGQRITHEFSTSPMRDADGKVRYFCSVGRDISERAAAAAALRREKEFSASILTAQRDTVVIVELDTGRLVRWNRRASEVSGYSDRELASSTIEQAHPPEQRERVFAALTKLRAGSPVTIELELMAKDGRRIPHEYSISVMPEESGPARFCCSVGRDISERVTAAAVLAREMDFSKNILAAQRDTVGIIDLHSGRLIRWNKRVAEVSGYSDHEITGLNALQFHPPEQHDQIRSAFAALLRGEQVIFELDLLTKDGRRIPYEFSTTLMHYQSGKSAYCCSVGRDISERAAAAAGLRASEEKFRLLAENMVDVIWSSDLAMNFTYVSPSVVAMLDRTPEECLRLGPTVTVTPESLRLISAALQEELAREAAQPGTAGQRTLSVDQYHRDGHIVNTELSTAFLRDAAGEVTSVIGVTRDVTERLRTQRALERSQALLTSAIDQSPMGIIVADVPGGRITLCNAAAGMIHNLPPGENLAGKMLADYVPDFQIMHLDGTPYDPAQLPLACAMRGEVIVGEEMMVIYPDGSRRWLHGNGAPVRNAQGDIVAAIVVFAEHTLQHLAQRSLEESETRLRAVLESIPCDIWMIGEDGRYVEQNEASRALWGDIRGKTPAQAAGDSARAEVWEEQNRRVLAGEKVSGEVVYRINGQDRHYLYLLNCIGGRDHPLGIVGANIDITDRKQAEAALHEREVLYRSLVETTNTGFVILSADDGTVLDANPLYVAMTGHQRLEEIRGRAVTEWTAPHDRERNARAVQDCLATGQVRNLVIDYRHPDGTIVPIEINASVQQTGGRRMVQTLCRDITDRRQAEAALHASEEKFAKAFNTSSVLMALSTIAEGRYVDVNEAFLQTLGFTRDEVIGRTAVELGIFVKSADRDRLMRTFARDGRLRNVEMPVRTHAGALLNGLFNLEEISIGGDRLLLTTMNNITDRMQAEAARLASELRYRTIFEHCGTALLFIAEDTTIMMCNHEFERLSGFARAEVEGKRSWTEFIADPDDLARMREYNRRRRSTGNGEVPANYDIAVLDRHGRRREIALSVVVMPDTRQSLCALLDITERKRAEDRVQRMNEELARANKELRSLDELKSNLLANVSHELRTPLVAVRGYAELMREGVPGPVNEAQRGQFGIMLRNIDRLLELIGNLLNFSRQERNGAQPVTSEFAVADLMAEVYALLLPRARERQVGLTLVPVAPALRLTADHHQLQQVLINLADNALKFTTVGGAVTMSAAAGENDTVCITVIDTGIGIPVKERDRIFERFYQIDSSSTRVYGGTGIGLAIAREIVELHGGRITVSSEVGKGTIFTVIMPNKPATNSNT